MLLFECTLSGGGATLSVTCDEEFAGETITCSKTGVTLTATCPSDSPYIVEFSIPESGTYTVSCTVDGNTYSTEVEVNLELETILEYGFSWPRWVTYGGLDPTDYEDLEDVFDDEAAVRQLMLVHDSADYLIEKITDDIDVLDDFVANDTAMKWLGLCDYVCDGIVAITGAEAKLLASTYWERYLKDHVPTMTSNSAPYGTISASTADSSYPSWRAFDGNDTAGWVGTTGATSSTPQTENIQYKFVNPICVKKIRLVPSNTSATRRTDKIRFYGSNDNSTWTPITEEITPDTAVTPEYYEVENDTYYLYLKAIVTSSGYQAGVRELQFYGRSLNVSVPVMTTNTAPYGVASSSSDYNTIMVAWKTFDGTNSNSNDAWRSASNQVENSYLMYKSSTPFVVKAVAIRNRNDSSNIFAFNTCKIQGSNDGFVNDIHDVTDVLTTQNKNYNQWSHYAINNSTAYKDYRILVLTSWNYNGSSIDSANVAIGQLQFYGVDYSEKEFETGTTKKWLYDHGVELETLTINNGSTGACAKNLDDVLIKSNTNAESGNVVAQAYFNGFDLTPYDIVRINHGDTAKYFSSSNTIYYSVRATATVPIKAGDSSIANKLITSLLADGEYFDVSSVNQQCNLVLYSNTTDTYCNITELWLE